MCWLIKNFRFGRTWSMKFISSCTIVENVASELRDKEGRGMASMNEDMLTRVRYMRGLRFPFYLPPYPYLCHHILTDKFHIMHLAVYFSLSLCLLSLLVLFPLYSVFARLLLPISLDMLSKKFLRKYKTAIACADLILLML